MTDALLPEDILIYRDSESDMITISRVGDTTQVMYDYFHDCWPPRPHVARVSWYGFSEPTGWLEGDIWLEGHIWLETRAAQ